MTKPRSPVRANVGWLLSERGLQLLVSVTVGVAITRYLGPSDLGAFSFALAIVGLFLPVAQAAPQVVVRDLASDPDRAAGTMGASAALNLGLGSVFYIVVLVLAVTTLPGDRSETWLVVALVGVPLVVSPVQVVDYWFQSTLQARPAASARSLALLVGAALRISVIVFGGGLVALAATVSAETLLAAVFLLVAYRRRGQSLHQWRWQRRRTVELARDSFPLLLSSLAAAFYMRIDQVMLGVLSDERQVGLYSAAVRLSEAAYFLPMALTASVAPGIARLRVTNRRQYEIEVRRVIEVLALIGLVIALPAALVGPRVVEFLFGDAFAASGAIFSVHVLSMVFVFMGVGQSVWTVNESLQRLAMWRTIGGAAINVGLNLLLISPLGGLGAAIATLVAQAFATMLGNALHPATRPVFRTQVACFKPQRLVGRAQHELKMFRDGRSLT